MGVPEVNGLYPESFQALLTGDRHVLGITAESKSLWQPDTAELGSDEDVFAFLRVQCQPLADDNLGIALPVVFWLTIACRPMVFRCARSGSYVKVAAVPKGTSNFIRVVKQGETFRIGDCSNCSRAWEANSHRSKTDTRDHGAILAKRTFRRRVCLHVDGSAGEPWMKKMGRSLYW